MALRYQLDQLKYPLVSVLHTGDPKLYCVVAITGVDENSLNNSADLSVKFKY